jgi:hypothetical protein
MLIVSANASGIVTGKVGAQVVRASLGAGAVALTDAVMARFV